MDEDKRHPLSARSTAIYSNLNLSARSRQVVLPGSNAGSRFPATERSRQLNLSQVSTISATTGFDDMSRVSRYSSASSASSAYSVTSSAASSFKAALTGHTHKSRLCETCFPKVLSGSKPPMNAFVHSKAWVPRGVFTHMLSYLNHVDLCLASMTCRFWYKRALLDITWRPLYIKEFGDDESSPQRESLVAFQRDVHGIGFENLSWYNKFAIRWTARKAAEKKKSFLVMSSLLASLKLSKYAALFEAEEIDIESLCLMNAGHL
ncbi:Serine protease family S01B, partial [Phytophthora palmivora]